MDAPHRLVYSIFTLCVDCSHGIVSHVPWFVFFLKIASHVTGPWPCGGLFCLLWQVSRSSCVLLSVNMCLVILVCVCMCMWGATVGLSSVPNLWDNLRGWKTDLLAFSSLLGEGWMPSSPWESTESSSLLFEWKWYRIWGKASGWWIVDFRPHFSRQ